MQCILGVSGGLTVAGVSRAGLQCYCRAGWRAGRLPFVGRIWPAGRRLPAHGLDRSTRFSLNRSVHSDTNPTSLESIQPCYNYCAKTIYSHISTITWIVRNAHHCNHPDKASVMFLPIIDMNSSDPKCIYSTLAVVLNMHDAPEANAISQQLLKIGWKSGILVAV